MKLPWFALVLLALVLPIRPGLSDPDGEAEESVLGFRVAYATFIGGSEWEQPREIIPSPDGSVVVGGQTSSADLPVTEGVVQPEYGGEPVGTGHPGLMGGDCFVARLGPKGERFSFVTYFGGSKQERAVYGMALDREGNIVFESATRSRDLPTTAGAVQPAYGGGKSDTFVAKLSPDGRKTLWCTYLGGTHEDWPRGGLALDAQDNVIIVGGVGSSDFAVDEVGKRAPETRGGGDAMIVKLAADGSKLHFAKRFGGSKGEDIMGARVGPGGEIYIAGHTKSRDLPVTEGAAQKESRGLTDCWFACLSPDADEVRYCTYLGGDANEFAEHRPALLPDGSVLLPGVTSSSDFPTSEGAFQEWRKGKNDAFLTKLSPDGKSFAISTLVGGNGGEFFLMPTVDEKGRIYLVGGTSSRDFPVTESALQKTYGGGKGDAVFVVLSADGRKLLYSTYLGGSGHDLIRTVALDGKGGVYLAGNTNSKDFPFISKSAAQKDPGGKDDGIIIKLTVEN